jgi:FkbM family methyltransferase
MKAFVKKIARIIILKVYFLFYDLFKLFHRILSELAFKRGITAYLVAPVIIKDFKYKQIEIKAQIESYWNYWRMKKYEKYPVEKIEDYIKSSKGSDDKIVYYEIGANVGYSFLVIGKMLKEKGETFAFEVEPANFKTLSNNILINQLHNATAMPIGIAESFTIEKFYFNRYHDKAPLLPSSGMGMHSIKFDANVHKEQAFYRAALMPLDSIINLFSMPFPTHLFIDAYEAQDAIISGMKSTLKNDRLKMVMMDIESELEKSKAHKIVLDSGFKLVDCAEEKGEGVVSTVYQCTYSKQ